MSVASTAPGARRRARKGTRSEPIWPAAPVTRTRMFLVVLLLLLEACATVAAAVVVVENAENSVSSAGVVVVAVVVRAVVGALSALRREKALKGATAPAGGRMGPLSGLELGRGVERIKKSEVSLAL